jgi:NAD(P)-dependent dehydrogenase (short-subunit alcohol dehydrogenase family)
VGLFSGGGSDSGDIEIRVVVKADQATERLIRERIAAQSRASGQTPAQVEAMFIARQPMGRLGRAEEIAALAVYLASDESGFTSGTAQLIDGGWTL